MSYLQQNNPRLIELKTRYSTFNDEVTGALEWTDECLSPDNILYFRGHNPYVWQLQGDNMNVESYTLATYYVKSIDKFGLLESLKEDDFFGNFTFTIDNRLVSRDLLDSINEIYFLEKQLSISTIKNPVILDIGAGYGRLAHRITCALPNIAEYLCTDAFPVSTFISEYYIRFRDLEGKVKVIPLDEIENSLARKHVNIAVNIHSFPECKISAIEWWLSVLAKYRVQYLMIVPNCIEPFLLTDDGKDFSKVIEEHGYKLIAKEPKYSDPNVQKYALNPAYYFLFEFNKSQ